MGSQRGFVFNGGAAATRNARFLASKIKTEFNGPTAYNHYSVGWAHATGTPYKWTKQVASHWGGTRATDIVRWPRGIKSNGTRGSITSLTSLRPFLGRLDCQRQTSSTALSRCHCTERR